MINFAAILALVRSFWVFWLPLEASGLVWGGLQGIKNGGKICVRFALELR